MSLASGTRLGTYEILSPLGSGGMGEVYRARDTRLGRDAALKVLPEAVVGDAERRDRFDREARALAALNHPNIVTIYGVEDLGTSVVLAMELIDGRPLSASIPPGGMPTGRLLQLGTQLADAISAAHDRGIVHRDLKPANVMVTADGRLKVLDFGLARFAQQAPELATVMPTGLATGEGRILGTVAYMSPEQAEGKPVDHRSDIFSLGIVLYEMATGRPPFTGDSSMAILSAIIKDTPGSVTDLNPDMPREFARMVKRCLAKDPEQRYQSAKDVRNEFEELKREIESGEIGTPGASTSVGDSRRRRRRLVAAGAMAGAVLLIALSVTGWFYLQSGTAPTRSKDSPATAADAVTLDAARVAVARFENLTGDSTLDQVGAIAQDFITTALAKIPGVDAAQTMGIHLALPKPGSAPGDPVGMLAQLTGAGTIVTGSYYLSGSDLQVQCRLVDPRTGKVAAVIDPVTGPRSAPMTVLDGVRQRVMGAVAARISPGGMATPDSEVTAPPLYDAYREYVVGGEIFLRDTPGAIRHFEAAARIDPDFFSPQVYAVIAYSNLGHRDEAGAIVEQLNARRDHFGTAERLWIDALRAGLEGRWSDAVARYRELEGRGNRDLRLKVMMVGNLLRLNHPAESLQELGALRSLAKQSPALTRTPAFTWLGPLLLEAQALHALGKYDEELRVLGEGKNLHVDERTVQVLATRALAALGRSQEAEAVLTAFVSLPGTGATAGTRMLEVVAELRAHGHREAALALASKAVAWYTAYVTQAANSEASRYGLARALHAAERWKEARPVFTKLAAEHPDSLAYQGYAGALAARAGDRVAAGRISEALGRTTGKYLLGAPTFNRARIAALLGDRDGALELLRRAFAEGKPFDLSVHQEMDLEPLRGYPPFEELVKPKG
jgi:serine/threonine protein kinase/tetratricopeptide (TPR) repeat protein